MYYNNSYNDFDVVISTDITISRNLNNYPFPNKMDEIQIASATEEIITAIFSEGNLNKDSWDIITNKTPKNEMHKLLQKGIITEKFVNNKSNLSALISNDKSASIMLCCDDHIKANVSYNGNVLEDAHGVISKIDNIICGQFKLAFMGALGFLSSDISKLGTAMKASVKLHLPGLEKSGELGEIKELVSRIGLTLEKYCEKDIPLYALTNRITMGITEAEAIRNLSAIVGQINTKERYARIECFGNSIDNDYLNNKAKLINADSLDSDSALSLLYKLRLSASMGVGKASVERLSGIIEAVSSKNETPQERAEYLKNILA